MHVMGYVSLFSKSMAGLESSGLIRLREDVTEHAPLLPH
jgi:hypothetical protein